MIRRSFAYTPTGAKRITIEERDEHVEVFLDDKSLAQFLRSELRKTRTLTLDDGAELSILFLGGLGGGWMLARDGKHLPGSAGDPAWRRLREASNVFLIIAALTTIFALALALASGDSALAQKYLRLGVFVEAGVYAACGLFTRRGSVVALITGAAWIVADSVSVLATLSSEIPALRIGFLLRIGMIFFVLRAIPSAFELRHERRRKGLPDTFTALENLPDGSKLFDHGE